jgi:hypothetical protein
MSLIPKKIYQSWKTKELSGKMATNVSKVQKLNPEYEHVLYDDKDCREFLLQHFGQNYADAFDALIPGAFKCDFWRYAMLYVHGGIYMDIDMEPLVPFREIIDPENEFVSIVDKKHLFTPKCNIYQAFLAAKPKHPIMYNSMIIALVNIITRRQETLENLSITGPVVVGIAMNMHWNIPKTHAEIKPGKHDNGKIKLLTMDDDFTYNLKGDKVIINRYDGYSRGPLDYATSKFYHDDPRSDKRKIIMYIVLGILGLAVLGIILTFVFKRKWKKCEESCSASRASSPEI